MTTHISLSLALVQSVFGQTGYDPVTRGGPAPDPPQYQNGQPVQVPSTGTSGNDLLDDIFRGTNQMLEKTRRQYPNLPPAGTSNPGNTPPVSNPLINNNPPGPDQLSQTQISVINQLRDELRCSVSPASPSIDTLLRNAGLRFGPVQSPVDHPSVQAVFQRRSHDEQRLLEVARRLLANQRMQLVPGNDNIIQYNYNTPLTMLLNHPDIQAIINDPECTLHPTGRGRSIRGILLTAIRRRIDAQTNLEQLNATQLPDGTWSYGGRAGESRGDSLYVLPTGDILMLGAQSNSTTVWIYRANRWLQVGQRSGTLPESATFISANTQYIDSSEIPDITSGIRAILRSRQQRNWWPAIPLDTLGNAGLGFGPVRQSLHCQPQRRDLHLRMSTAICHTPQQNNSNGFRLSLTELTPRRPLQRLSDDEIRVLPGR